MFWDDGDWVIVDTGDINLITEHYPSYVISVPTPQPFFEETPEAVIWPQHAKVHWN